jgi:hypothetical protein
MRRACLVVVAAVLAALWAVVSACHVDTRDPEYPRLPDEPPPEAQMRVPAPAPPPDPTRPRMTRAQLYRVLDAGPGAFLRTVRVRASHGPKGFAGWEVLALWPDAHIDIGPGDVVVRVNGRPIERPEQLNQVWDSLRSVFEFVVEYRRGGERRELRVTVVD